MIDALAALWPFNGALWPLNTGLWPLHWMRPWWLLALAPTLLAFYWQWRNHQQQSQWQRLIEPALLTHLLHNPVNARLERRRGWPLACAALASCIAIVALAGPAWQKLPQTPLQKHNSLVIIADLTLSMHTQDVAPSRLTRMRYKLLELLARRDEGQTALIAYSGDAHLVSPLTDDARTIAALVPALAPEIMPSIGSNAAAAFELAGSILADAPAPVRLVWFTDEVLDRDHDRIRKVIDQHRAELVIVGIGTATGGPVPLPSGKFLKDQQQNIVTAQLSAGALQNLAAKVGGSYIGLRTDNADIDLALRDSLFDTPLVVSHSSSIERGAPVTAGERADQLVFDAWLDRGATLCLLLLPVALLAFRRGVVLACWCLLPVLTLHTPELLANPAPASRSESPAAAATSLWLTPDQRAQQLFNEQRYQDAAATFKREDWRGVAAFRGQQYEQAVAAFNDHLAALESANPHSDKKPGDDNTKAQQRLARGLYNRGHAQAYSGELQQAIDDYQRALELDPEFTTAAEAKALLEELLRKQAEQQQDKQQDDDKQEGEQQQGEKQKGEQQQSEPSKSDNQSGQQSDQEASQAESGQQSESESDSESQQQAQNSPAENGQDSRRADYRGDPDSDEQKDEQSGERAESAAAESESESDRDASQTAAEPNSDADAQQPSSAVASATTEGAEIDPERARLQQWLNKIEDDPGGLLRRKFQYERQLRERERTVIDSSEDAQLW